MASRKLTVAAQGDEREERRHGVPVEKRRADGEQQHAADHGAEGDEAEPYHRRATGGVVESLDAAKRDERSGGAIV